MSEQQRWRIKTEGPGEPLPDGQIPGPGTAQTPRSKSSTPDPYPTADDLPIDSERLPTPAPADDQPTSGAKPQRSSTPVSPNPVADESNGPAKRASLRPDNERRTDQSPPTQERQLTPVLGHSRGPNQSDNAPSVDRHLSNPADGQPNRHQRHNRDAVPRHQRAQPIQRPQPVEVAPSSSKSKRWLLLAGLAAIVVVASIAGYLFQTATDSDSSEAAELEVVENETEPNLDTDTTVQPNEVDEATAAQVSPGGLSMTLEDFRFSIRATVPDQRTKDALEAATQTTYGNYGKADLTLDTDLAVPSWIDSMPSLISTFWTLVDGSITITDEETIVRGRATDQEGLDTFLGAIRPELGFPPLRNEVRIVDLQPASIQVVGDEGLVTLSGELPTETVRQGIVDSANQLFGEDRVRNEITLSPGIFAPFPLIRFGGNMIAFAPFDNFELGVDRGMFYGVLSAGLTFEEAGSELTPASIQKLEGFPALFRASSWPIRITGHTDAVGSQADNQQLSEDRAQAIVKLFTDQGISPSRFEVIGKGESEPIADEATEAGRETNRRVVFEIGRQFAPDAES